MATVQQMIRRAKTERKSTCYVSAQCYGIQHHRESSSRQSVSQWKCGLVSVIVLPNHSCVSLPVMTSSQTALHPKQHRSIDIFHKLHYFALKLTTTKDLVEKQSQIQRINIYT